MKDVIANEAYDAAGATYDFYLTVLGRNSVDGRGLVDPDEVRRALRPNTKLITIMLANNETGVLQPAEEIGKIAAEAEVYFHTDAVQAVGQVPVDFAASVCLTR